MRAFTYLTSLTILLAGSTANAEPLSEVALYHRCYVRITGQFPDYVDDDRLDEVRRGQTTAIDACLAVFDEAAFVVQGNQERPAESYELTDGIVANFQALHSTWFLNRLFPSNDDISLGTETFYEAGEPAAYITRALFNPAVPVSSIWTAQEHLRVLREPEFYSVFEIPAEQFVFEDPPILAVGSVLGIERPGPLARRYDTGGDDEERRQGTLEIGAHAGGGFMGAPAYLLTTINETPDFRANGGRKMPRKWAKAVLHDALCRDLPVVRVEDAIPFVVADSQVPFRRQALCSQCHASIDRMAATIRGFKYNELYGYDETFGFSHGGMFARFDSATEAPESGWPAVEDPTYDVRPPRGTLYFRDHTGQLIDLPVQGPAELGARLAELDGPYVCLAQRYYRYFTGIDAFIGDPANFPASPDSPDAFYRDRVIELGRQLRTSGDLRALIEAILRSPEYRESDFGVSP